ncbi:polyketide synthase [Penicillium malachiteum]|uniref:polyketide synthase n=1 Tax=Penicillium malachiteum TaxID=1324776 RepID=UPI0025499705|nr:polyketide synthase [Penicillium malachiteum]KAJ5713088.1 polyketide synthase [Penicillium malachiteum]
MTSDIQPLQFSSKGAYLITGGTRVSRCGLPPASEREANDVDLNNLISRIAELKALGVNVRVLSIDASKAGADSTLRHAIDELDLPPVKGVLHAAGIAKYHSILRCILSEVADVLATKVIGGLNLDTLFPPGTLDFFYLVSSVGKLVGFEGQLSYAAQTLSWRVWQLIEGSRSNLATRIITKGMQYRGLATMSIEEAFAAWDRFASLETDHVVVVRALELEVDEPLRHPVLKYITPRKQATHNITGSSFSNYPEDAIAIVDLACRTAAGDTTEDFWQTLRQGKAGKMWGNFMSDVESFDHQFFKKSKREAAALDPHQRIMLETTYKAV